MIVFKLDKHYDAPIYVIVLVLIFLILLFNNWYRKKYNPNKDTIIKKVLRNNPKLTNGLIAVIETYDNVYTYRIMEIDTYLERFKLYRDIERICANFYHSYIKFSFKKMKLIGFISYIFFKFILLFLCYVCIQIYYLHILSYRFIAIAFLLVMIRKIFIFWNSKLTEKENVIYEDITNIINQKQNIRIIMINLLQQLQDTLNNANHTDNFKLQEKKIVDIKMKQYTEKIKELESKEEQLILKEAEIRNFEGKSNNEK